MTAKQRQARARFKKVVQEASKLRKKNKKLTQAQAVKQAWAIQYSKEGKSRVGKVQKTSVKAKRSKKSGEMHTDTKSHNVNIRVVSGVNQYIQVVFYRYKLKYGKRVKKSTPLETIVIGMPKNINPEKFGKPIISQGIMIYKSAKEKFNYGNEKGELIRYLVLDDENYQKSKSAAKLSALTELF